MKPTFQCNDLRAEHIGKEVIVAGWVQRRRDHGGLIFIDLRDSSGLVQVVFNPELNPDSHKIAHEVRSEYVLAVKGKVNRRPEGTKNPNLPTGEVEIPADELEILNKSETPPFVIDDSADDVAEDIRLKYRYLDIRRPSMLNNLKLRHKVYMATRNFLNEQGFIEIETPVLTKSTPEGARDFLVPCRLIPGTFFAMPQSPQLFKQLLMVAGVGKYFQIAKCYRDEDLRADRQFEFTQIDIEMSFIEEEDVYKLTEDLMHRIFLESLGMDLPIPFPRMAYAESMRRYGCDKPDVRFGMELVDVGDIVADSDFKVFASTVANEGNVKGIVAPGFAKASRKDIDDLTEYAKGFGAKGLVSFKVLDGDVESPVKKFFSQTHIEKLIERMGAKAGDLMLLVADKPAIVAESLNRLRLKLGGELGLIDESKFAFLWIVDFPLFHYDENEKRLDSEHHPFTGIHPDDMHLLETDPLKVRSRSYDLVLNGNEMASGSIRIHQMEMQEKIFSILQLTSEDIEGRFGFFLEALKFGAPPHGGIAPGLDRLVATMAGAKSIRDVIAFPKTQSGTCLVTGAPSTVSDKQLKELNIKVDL
jgi:aspartyl-tRNA synthetase